MGQSDESERFRILLEGELTKAGFTSVDAAEKAGGVLTGALAIRVYADESIARATVVLKTPDGRHLWGKDFDRWQIEVNHRDEKDTLGVGQAQLWNVKAVPKQPVLAVAAYSVLLLASLIAFGAERGAAYAALPKWRRKACRPSCLDLITLLRKEMAEQPAILKEFEVKVTEKQLLRAAAA